MAKPRALQRDSESEALFGEFAANVPEILWMREVGSERILYVSPAWEAVTGHPRPQHRNEFLGIVHPEDAARVRQEADEAPQGGVDHRYRILRRPRAENPADHDSHEQDDGDEDEVRRRHVGEIHGRFFTI